MVRKDATPDQKSAAAARLRAWRKTAKGKQSQQTYRRNYVVANREAVNLARVDYRAQRRNLVLEGYGGVCNCPGCHVVHLELLTIDHVKGDGAKERKARGIGSRTGVYFFNWLIENNFPPEYQALCGSCNLAKGTKDKCPLAGEEH